MSKSRFFRLDESLIGATSTKRVGKPNPKFFLLDGFLHSRAGSTGQNESSLAQKGASMELRPRQPRNSRSPKELDVFAMLANNSA